MHAASSVLLDLDPAYAGQPRLRRAVARRVSLPPLPRLLCPVERARAALAAASWPAPALVFLGSGDYHYLTALLLERIGTPVHLVLVDHHPDDDPGWDAGFLSCGGWVAWARQRGLVAAAWHVGTGPLPPARWLRQRLGAGSARPPVYVSIDKDALRPQDAATNWDQGSLGLAELLPWLEELLAGCSLAGMDVCGEVTPRLPGFPSPAEARALARNEAANLALLGLWRRLTQSSPSPARPGSGGARAA